MFSKREGILVSKLGTETHGPVAGQQSKLPSVPAAGSKAKAPQFGRGRENNGVRPFAQVVGVVDVLFCKAVGAVGLYHVHPCSSSCFPASQQAFVGEMGQKRRLVAASSYVFEKGRNFSKQVER